MIELNQLRMAEGSMWRQKSRVSWLKKGDRNTTYFHKVASNVRYINSILSHMVGLSDNAPNEEIKRKVTEAFDEHFKSGNGLH